MRAVAAVTDEQGRPRGFLNRDAKDATPFVVSFDGDERLVGTP